MGTDLAQEPILESAHENQDSDFRDELHVSDTPHPLFPTCSLVQYCYKPTDRMQPRLEDQGTQQNNSAPKWYRAFDQGRAFLHCSGGGGLPMGVGGVVLMLGWLLTRIHPSVPLTSRAIRFQVLDAGILC